ncbi:hypothetical protein CEUSTIGMA_g586.t1 [Chlamydomonas eustigma]|uniref:2-phytyl-1,4-beta-naphthoquinone methyltransferase, chloroplastic n=1 Tax=Chlamydomonas eustigma TaxID=1157962 RepID=A0A250WQN7_9CHLO|nr:hypothetical protein CEUSTIGMA_g586.t1 [Chlamydomonas eustigma]|eukprot:GAX73133.1 hypothetical protein CEUSTIGMA_g586.t1 [Chlamydomonas eustigma]
MHRLSSVRTDGGRIASNCKRVSPGSLRVALSDREEVAVGPSGAFTPGQEAEARRKLFNRIAPVYDDLNNRLSFGQQWVWKQQTVKYSGAKKGHKVLDVCCGSGDIALLLSRLVGPKGQVIGLDFAADMLGYAEARQKEQSLPGLEMYTTPMQWVQGDATDMPFEDAEFDGATMGYGLRNVDNRPKALSELCRVLKPGASVAILDFNNSVDPTVDSVQAWFLENLVVPAARQYGLEKEYQYLRPSIKGFPTGQEQVSLALEAGFSSATHYEVGFGLMGILVATKR